MSDIAADRLYLLWTIEEQVLSALGGHINQEQALTNILSFINESPAEMKASDEEVAHLQEQKSEIANLDLLIKGAERDLTPDQVADDYWYHYDEE